MGPHRADLSIAFWRTRACQRLAILALAVTFALQCVYLARENSLANDEAKHLATGWLLLQTGRCCLGVDNSPLTAWFALPLLVGLDAPISTPTLGTQDKPDAHAVGREVIFGSPDPEAVIFAGRMMNIIAGVFMLLAAAALANRIFGSPAGLLTAAVLAFEPNVIAQFSLMSTDALFVATALAYLLALDRSLTTPSMPAAVALGLALGVAILAKYTGLALLPATAALALLYRHEIPRRRWRRWLAEAIIALLVALVVIWAGYGAHISTAFPFASIPGFIDGLAQVKGLVSYGFMAYYNGETGHYWPTYFLACLALKTPLPELIVWMITLAATASTVMRGGLGRDLVPVATAAGFLAIGMASNLNIGVRHILMVYVAAAVAAGALVHWRPRFFPRPKVRGAALLLLLLALAVESVRFAPHEISYFNQFAGGPRGGIRYLGDSNLDWGQDLKALKAVMEREGIDELILAYLGTTDPEFYGINYQYLPHMFYGKTRDTPLVDPAREVLAVSTNNLQGIVSGKDDYAWLRDRVPFATAGFSIYLYDITGDARAHAHLATIYAANGLDVLAGKERAKADAPGPGAAAGTR